MRRSPSYLVSAAALPALLLVATMALGQPTQDDHPVIGNLPPAPQEVYFTHPPGVEVETILDNLDVVWGLEFAPDGRLFLTEKPGRIRVVSRDFEIDPTPWATLTNVNAETRERGLMGLALHPEFARQPWVYVMYTVTKGDGVANRVSRFREVDGRGTGEEVLLDDLPGESNHNGGRIRFGPDGMLYIGAGEARDRSRAQRLDIPAGAILRITPEGAIPPDNPRPGNPIWAYGLRNPQGLAFRPSDGTLFAADHGPTVEWRDPRVGAYDEINIIRKDGNYGWPLVVGAPGQRQFVDPLLAWIPSVPPGDLAFYDADLMPELKGDLLYSTLMSEALIRIRFQDPDDPDKVTAIERWFNTRIWRPGERGDSVYGRLRGMTIGPDGAIYVGTSNRDTRRDPLPDDDRVLRIAPTGR